MNMLVVYHLTAGGLPSPGGLPSHCWWSTMSLLVVYHLNAGSLPSHCWWSTIL